MRHPHTAAAAPVELLESRLCLSSTATAIDTTSNSVALADMNNDGKKDMIVTRFGHNGGLAIRMGRGNGTFAKAHAISAFGFQRGADVDIGDFNQDGNIDIVVYGGKGSGNGALYVLLGNGDGTFQAPTRQGGSLFAGGTSGSLNDVRLAVGDVDGDNHVDIVVSDPHLALVNGKATGDELYLLLGNGDGTFQTGTPIA